jgi:putative peptide zinc metalloprotease protein
VAAAPAPDTPERAEGLELLGTVQGSGHQAPPSLVRRGDGQAVQLTRLLYLTLEAVDGRRRYEEVAEAVSTATDRLVSADDVRMLCEQRLRPLGLLRGTDGAQPQVRRTEPLLGLKFRFVVSDPATTRRITAPFARLFHPLVVTVAVPVFLAGAAWLLLHRGVAAATHQAFEQPGLLLAVFALTVLSAAFHEFGHAAAAQYGGARPGAMGAGLYLVWPAFYTDVTDSYRLGRLGRLRTDLGGLYFNALVAIGMVLVWWATQWEALLLVVITQLLQMVRQLVPLVRFDGYHVLADLTGVPDLYRHIGPTLRGALPGRRRGELAALKPWARAVVVTWVVLVVPLLLGTLVLTVLGLPRVLASAAAALHRQGLLVSDRFGQGDLLGVLEGSLAAAAIAIPVLGMLVLLARVAGRLVRSSCRWGSAGPVRRVLLGLAGLAAAGTLAWAWWPSPDTYRPVQPDERGTLLDAADLRPASHSSARPPGLAGAGSEPATRPVSRTSPARALVEGERRVVRTLWPAGEVPTADQPKLAVVLTPRPGPGGTRPTGPDGPAPTWVFPFDRPAPPGPGDNQALAVNAQDGSVVYDVALALVWADQDTVLNTNEAYALASCTGCRTVAVAFQVVLVVGPADVIVPQNVAVALNYQCSGCLTYALATQLVVSLPGRPEGDTRAALDRLWARIAAESATLQQLPLSELKSRLTGYEREILAVIRPEVLAPTTSTTTSTATSATSAGSTTTGPVADQPVPSTVTLTTTAGSSGSAGTEPARSTTATTAPAPSTGTTTEPFSTAGTPDPTTSSTAPTTGTSDPSPAAATSGETTGGG